MVAVAVGGAALAATNHLIAVIGHIFGFRKNSEEKKKAESDERIRTAMRAEITVVRREIEGDLTRDISEMRQHLSLVQKGVEGKQAFMEQRLISLYEEMRDRDERLSESLHTRISTSMAEIETRLSRQIESLDKHITEVVNAFKPRR